MKLNFRISPSLDEAMYRVKITKIDDAPTSESAKKQYDDILRRVTFEVLRPVDDTVKIEIPKGTTGELIIWPQRAKWMYQQLVDKADIKDGIEDDQELVGHEVDLFFSHSYEDPDTGAIVLKKQWKMYGDQN